MVQLLLRLTAVHGRAHQLVEALQPHARRATRCSGCRAAHLAADVEHADVFWYCEEWDDAAALEAMMRTEQFSQLLVLMETSASQPLLEFRAIGECRGLDYVAAVRAG
jgi:quinol monooxygenase YgiN